MCSDRNKTAPRPGYAPHPHSRGPGSACPRRTETAACRLLAGTAFLLASLNAPGCIVTQEKSSPETILIDPSPVYGQALQVNVQEARRAAAADPLDPAPHYFLARAYLVQNDLESAEREFGTILELAPGSPGPYYELGRICVLKGTDEAAIPLFLRALELKADFPEAHFALYRLYEKLGDLERARPHRDAYEQEMRRKRPRGATDSPAP